MHVSNNLTKMFAGLFRKQGCQVVEYEYLDVIEFENAYMKGMVLFDKEKKYHRIKWTTKGKYEILDIPINNGAVSVEFKKVFDLFDFLQRRLMWKKR